MYFILILQFLFVLFIYLIGLFIHVYEKMVKQCLNCEECKKRNKKTIGNISSRIEKNEYKVLKYIECSICINNMEMEDIERLRCKHFFHRQCLTTWMKIKPTCPICRTKECCVRIIN